MYKQSPGSNTYSLVPISCRNARIHIKVAREMAAWGQLLGARLCDGKSCRCSDTDMQVNARRRDTRHVLCRGVGTLSPPAESNRHVGQFCINWSNSAEAEADLLWNVKQRCPGVIKAGHNVIHMRLANTPALGAQHLQNQHAMIIVVTCQPLRPCSGKINKHTS